MISVRYSCYQTKTLLKAAVGPKVANIGNERPARLDPPRRLARATSIAQR